MESFWEDEAEGFGVIPVFPACLEAAGTLNDIPGELQELQGWECWAELPAGGCSLLSVCLSVCPQPRSY